MDESRAGTRLAAIAKHLAKDAKDCNARLRFTEEMTCRRPPEETSGFETGVKETTKPRFHLGGASTHVVGERKLTRREGIDGHA